MIIFNIQYAKFKSWSFISEQLNNLSLMYHTFEIVFICYSYRLEFSKRFESFDWFENE